METVKIKITLTEEMLGMTCSDPKIHEEYIASRAPDAPSTAEEVAAIGVEEVVTKGRTVFPRTDTGEPFVWDYQIKGMFKDFCGFKIAYAERRLALGVEIVLVDLQKYFAHRRNAIGGMANFEIAKRTLNSIGLDCPIWLVGIGEES